MRHFSRTLVRLRALSGFKTAYAFYHSNGGRRVFPFTYAHYLKIERGGSLPQPAALLRIVETLRNYPSEREYSQLMTDYLRDMCGNENVYGRLFAPLLARSPKSEPLNPIRNLIGRSIHHTTPAQLQAVVSSPSATACFIIATNIPRIFSVAELAALTSYPSGDVLEGLKRLKKAGLLRRVGTSGYQATRGDMTITLPRHLPEFSAVWRKNLRELASKSGQNLYDGRAIVRIERATVEAGIKRFQEVIREIAASFVSSKEDVPGAEIYLLEINVAQLFSTEGAEDAPASRAATGGTGP
jgi:hypothetical protein